MTTNSYHITIQINEITMQINELTIHINEMTMKINGMAMKINEMTMTINEITMKINEMTIQINGMTMEINEMTIQINEMTMNNDRRFGSWSQIGQQLKKIKGGLNRTPRIPPRTDKVRITIRKHVSFMILCERARPLKTSGKSVFPATFL